MTTELRACPACGKMHPISDREWTRVCECGATLILVVEDLGEEQCVSFEVKATHFPSTSNNSTNRMTESYIEIDWRRWRDWNTEENPESVLFLLTKMDDGALNDWLSIKAESADAKEEIARLKLQIAELEDDLHETREIARAAMR